MQSGRVALRPDEGAAVTTDPNAPLTNFDDDTESLPDRAADRLGRDRPVAATAAALAAPL